MTLAYTRDAAEPAIMLFAMSLSPNKILTSEVCFLRKAKVSSEQKMKVFGKSTVAIHSLRLTMSGQT